MDKKKTKTKTFITVAILEIESEDAEGFCAHHSAKAVTNTSLKNELQSWWEDLGFAVKVVTVKKLRGPLLLTPTNKKKKSK